MKRPVLTIIALALSAAALAGCGNGAERQAASRGADQASGKSPIGGAFQLVDQNGRRVTERDLLGKPSLIFFGFTYCPEVCPTTLLHMTKWLKELGPDGDKLNAFYVTVDPQRDTSEQLKRYLTAFDPRIRGLTGTPAQIADVAEKYRAYYKRVPLENGDYVMDHSTMVYMMDGQGEFVGPIGYGEPDVQVMPLLRDLVAGRRPVTRAAPDPKTAVERSAT